MHTRFGVAICALLVALLAGFGAVSSAQDKFDKPVRIVVITGAGAPLDVLCRIYADELSQRLGKDVSMDVVVDPRILGGLKLQYGDRLIDASVATRLQQLRRLLADAT